MKFSANEIMDYLKEEDVKFIRLAFCDVFGKQKNISVMPSEIERAFDSGIAIDASLIEGFEASAHNDLFLHPDPSTISVLPWRPDHGKVVRMFCDIKYPDGTPFENDTRYILQQAVDAAKQCGINFCFGSEMEFYLFMNDENGMPTDIPYDNAGYMDIAPDDKGENVRREICLTLERMGITPESSHHEEGPGQNEIDFKYSDALSAADNAVTFRSVVKTVAYRNGLTADFSPKPIENKAGNGFNINISVKSGNTNLLGSAIAGILEKIEDITVFLNPDTASYTRLSHGRAPKYISWSHEKRSQLIRIPADKEYLHAQLRSPDSLANPYIAFALLIYAGIYGISSGLQLPPAANDNTCGGTSGKDTELKALPTSLEQARKLALNGFAAQYLPKSVIEAYCGAAETESD